MSYGSWSGGIFILEIDRETGYPIHPEGNEEKGVDPYFGKHLAGGFHNSVEGPYILYDNQTGYYYLFVSYGSLVSNGGYQIRLFRSENPDGPYMDRAGETLDQNKTEHDKYGLKLMGNYNFPSFMQAYMAPGHNSAFINDIGDVFLVHHTRFDDGSEYHEPRIRRLYRTEDDWLTADPFAFNGSGSRAVNLSHKEVSGYYYTLNHTRAIGADIENAEALLFTSGGKILDGEQNQSGQWTYDAATGCLKIEMKESRFTGLLIAESDEAGNQVLSITAISDSNESLWGVQYKP